MVQLRVTGRSVKVPARYHTEPDWPWAQLAPVVSSSGDLSAGCASAHFHQLAACVL